MQDVVPAVVEESIVWEQVPPMMGRHTSTITEHHVNSRRSPRFMLPDVHPYVIPFAANSV